MPALSKIKDRDTGVEYDVKDAQARTEIAALKENGNGNNSGGNVDWLDPEEGEVFTSVVNTPDVPAPTLTGISASYTGGDVVIGTALSALVGIVVTAKYSDGTTKTVTGYTLSGSITEGSNTITVTYEGMTATFTVTGVEEEPEVTLSSISATYTGGNVAVGTAVNNLTGITVTAHYSDGTTAPVTGYTLSGTIAEGINTITVSYGGKTTTFTVTGEVEPEGGGSDDFTGTENAFIRDGYYYVNPLVYLAGNTQLLQIDAIGEDPNHAVVVVNTKAWADKTFLGEGTFFGNTIPYIGEASVSNIRNGSAFPDDHWGYLTTYVDNPSNAQIRIRIPNSVYESAGNDICAAIHSMTERMAIKLTSNYEDYLYELTDEQIDAMTGTPSTTLTADGYYTGFLTTSGIGFDTATTADVQCIPFGASGYGELNRETYGVRITSRFQYCVPSTVDTSSLDSFKAYLKTRGIKFLHQTAKS